MVRRVVKYVRTSEGVAVGGGSGIGLVESMDWGGGVMVEMLTQGGFRWMGKKAWVVVLLQNCSRKSGLIGVMECTYMISDATVRRLSTPTALQDFTRRQERNAEYFFKIRLKHAIQPSFHSEFHTGLVSDSFFGIGLAST